MQLVKFLGCKANFGYGHGFVLGEKEIMGVCITDADDIADLIPVVIGIQTEASLGFLGVVELTVTAVRTKPFRSWVRWPSPTM